MTTNDRADGPPAGLFGITNSNRNFAHTSGWSKNVFNSAFPASLLAYMHHKGMDPNYLLLSADNAIRIDSISVRDLFGADPLSPSLEYLFEQPYSPYKKMVPAGQTPKVDLMLRENATSTVLSGYEIKLTTIPDESTHQLSEEFFGSELVIRNPSIVMLACQICSYFEKDREELKHFFGNGYGQFTSYATIPLANGILNGVVTVLNKIISHINASQRPFLIQPIWRTIGKKLDLDEHCIDAFIWSDLAFCRLFIPNNEIRINDVTQDISRPHRAMVQLFFMLHDYAFSGIFNPKLINQVLTYAVKNDKAFSMSGVGTNTVMRSKNLTTPRITKGELKNIILHGGHLLLSPERRFDAAIAANKNIFNQDEK